MKTIFLLFTVYIQFSIAAYAQASTTKHTVLAGETITQIVKKYKVTADAIYKLNPTAQQGLKPNMLLQIPNPTTGLAAAVIKNKPKTHLVATKETIFGIEKKYDVTDEALKFANPDLEKNGLQIGQILNIPASNTIPKKTTERKLEKTIIHEVLAKETKYSIAKQYGITIEELDKKNTDLAGGLQVGLKLWIKGSAPKPETKPTAAGTALNKPTTEKKIRIVDFVDYVVKPKETLYSLTKTFATSKEELLSLNPALSNGLEEGMTIKVPSVKKVEQVVQAQETIKSNPLFVAQNSGTRKKIALLLPFNIAKIENDTVVSAAARFKKDKFLNMTLDFYAGALVAIDSIKQMGLKVEVQILDSQENKNSSAVPTLIKENNLESMDAIIGPFYQSNVEKTAELLSGKGTPVISPLSKDLGKGVSNLYQSITPVATVRAALFDFMRSKNGNMLAVVDKKKESIRQYIQENQKDVAFVPLSETGSLVAENLRKLLVKDQTNYVILETGNTGMIKSTLLTLLGAIKEYPIQLVVLEPNETLNTDEISLASLTKLKLLYASSTRENESAEAVRFERSFKKKNKILPNAFATRGFDLTFDTILRLCQEKSFAETATDLTTEQVDTVFSYTKKEDAGYVNKGVYIVYYDADMTIKQAK